MASRAEPTDHLSPDAELVLAALETTRDDTLELVAHLSDDQLEAVHSSIMSPLVWDLGHIAAYEDLWIGHRHGGGELLRGELAALYDAFETPRAVRGEIETLGPREAREYLAEVRARSIRTIAEQGIGDGQIVEMVLRHELQHTETMRQTMAIAGLLGARRRNPRADARSPIDGSTSGPGRSRWAPGRPGSPTTTSAPATPSSCTPSRSPAGP